MLWRWLSKRRFDFSPRRTADVDLESLFGVIRSGRDIRTSTGDRQQNADSRPSNDALQWAGGDPQRQLRIKSMMIGISARVDIHYLISELVL